MGSCFSSSAAASDNCSDCRSNVPPTAKVVALDGSLREFARAIKVHEVLGRDHPSSGFLCSADDLHYDSRIPALGALVTLQPGQLYFLLPASMLGYRLSGADMGDLAVKAVSALGSSPKHIKHKKGHGRISSMKMQVMPVADQEELSEVASAGLDHANLYTVRSFHDTSRDYNDKKKMMNVRMNRRSAAMLQRKLVLRSYNAQKLGTIEEVAE